MSTNDHWKQYEFSIKIDEYIFNRFVKNKTREPYNNFKAHKRAFPKVVCNFILRGKNTEEPKIYLWDVSERKPLGQDIDKN